MRYGATDYLVYRNRDDMYKFSSASTFDEKVAVRGLLVRARRSTSFRTIYSGWYQVPILYTWADVIIQGAGTQRASPTASAS